MDDISTGTTNLNSIPFTTGDLNEMQREHLEFHIKVLKTKPDVAKRIVESSIKPLKEEMAALRKKSSKK